jgi:hypothetical protein
VEVRSEREDGADEIKFKRLQNLRERTNVFSMAVERLMLDWRTTMKNPWIGILCLVGLKIFCQDVPYGHEFEITHGREGSQSSSSVAVLPDGEFVVCWLTANGNAQEIYGRVFTASGREKTAPFFVASIVSRFSLAKESPCVAALSDGFVVCWASDLPDGSGSGIFGQMFDVSGIKRNQEIPIARQSGDFSIAALSGGGFVVCWDTSRADISRFGSRGQVFNGRGERSKNGFPIQGMNQKVAGLTGGGFVVCYSRRAQGKYSWDIHGQLFDSSGSPSGDEFQVAAGLYNYLEQTRVGALTRGGFVVCWLIEEQSLATKIDVFGQVFNASGGPKTVKFQVNAHVDTLQANPSVGGLDGGGFVVFWTSHHWDAYDRHIFGQVFDEWGAKKEMSFRVNSQPCSGQDASSVAGLPGGGYIVTWDEDRPNDGMARNVYAKFMAPAPLRHDLSPYALVDPSNDATEYVLPVSFSWNSATLQTLCYPWEVVYDLYVSTDPEFSNPFVVNDIEDTVLVVEGLTPGRTHFWKVLARNITGDSLWSSTTNAFFVAQDATVGIKSEIREKPAGFALYPSYPNPFNSTTSIRFDMPSAGFIDLSIYDVHGGLVRTLLRESRNAGSHSVGWDGKDGGGIPVPSGVYVCRMEV